MFTVSRSTARLLVIAPFAALLVLACEHNLGPSIPPPGVLQSITVTPNPGGAVVLGTIQYTATGRDVTTAIVAIVPAPTWSVVAGGGTINASTGLFTGGATPGTFTNTIRATSGALSGFATAILTLAPPTGPQLGVDTTYGILAGSTVTCTTGGTINADVGVFPGSTTTGFPPCVITGATHLADAVADSAQQALTRAYDGLVALPCNTVVTPADLGGRTLPPGVYCAASSMAITGTVTLNGPATGVWVFQIGSTLTTATSSVVALTGGAVAKNVWWQVGSSATLGTSTTFRGNILALTSITLVDNATMLGRALARNGAVTLGTNNVITLP